MATTKASDRNKSTSSRTSAAKKSTTKKPAAKTEAAKVTEVVKTSDKTGSRLPKNIANIILAEIVGTFVLTLVALTTVASVGALYAGLAVLIIVLAIGLVSGAHINPAVTFGLWTMRRVKTVLVPIYWGAQIVGAIVAVALMYLVTNSQYSVATTWTSFSSVNWPVFVVEMIGMAVFMFGIAAVTSRDDVSNGVKAVGIGLSLTVALIAAGSLLTQVQSAAYQKYQKDAAKAESGKQTPLPHALMVKGAVLNPAVALAITENTESQLMGGSIGENEKQLSRAGLEVILGTLVGAAVGGNLYLLVTYRGKKS